MAIDILMPQFGMYMVEGILVCWRVPDRAHVNAGDVILEIENDKATQEVTTPSAGILKRISAEGDIMPVRGVLGQVLDPSEVVDGNNSTRIPNEVSDSTEGSSATIVNRLISPTNEIKASPLARKLAAEHGVNLASITGTGPGGRIGETDVQAAIRKTEESPKKPSRSVLIHSLLTGRRKVIAQRMMASLTNTAQLTIMREVDASALVQIRASLQRREKELGIRVSYDAILVKVLAVALKEHQGLNAVIEGDEIFIFEEVNVGVAIATTDGLVVPVVSGAETKTLLQIARIIEDFAERAGKGKLLPDEMLGGTVTLTNMGLFEVDTFTPILNLQESVILGVGRIVSRPFVIDNNLSIRPTVHLSLTWDHRIADGAEAGNLLKRIAEMITDCESLQKNE